VIFAGWSNFGYGFAVVISHGPFQTLYGHLSSVNVRCGENVVGGQPIGGVGSTGNSSGPHLHFELMYNGVRGNPAATIAF
jgi:murein DD-endopeptidase MepM/ murein hydrolase activator NlpD